MTNESESNESGPRPNPHRTLNFSTLRDNANTRFLKADRPAAAFPDWPDRAAQNDAEFERFKRKLLANVAVELKERRSESLRLYRPMPEQARFHACRTTFRILRGGNRGGKTLAALVELARMATGQDPHDKYPKEGLRILVVAKNSTSIAEVFVKSLLRRGAFQIIRDKKTGEWRSVNPDDPEDRARKKEQRPCAALIPKRFLAAEPVWENRGKGVVRLLKLHNDVEILFYSGESDPIQGVRFHAVFLDEEVSEDWFQEARMRIIDFEGCLIWSATPQSATIQFYELWQMAIDGNPAVSDFCVKTLDNKYLTDKQLRDVTSTITNDEERHVRLDGGFKIGGVLVYSSFDKGLHLITPEAERELMPEGVPRDWCIYVAIDPGTNPLAVLFVGVPPDQKRWYVFDELYISKASAFEFGEAMHRKLGHLQQPEMFIIDVHGAKLSDLGSGRLPLDQYREELIKRGIKSRLTGSGFYHGCDNELTRINAVKRAMEIDPTFRVARLAVVQSRCPNWLVEVAHYKHKRGPGDLVMDETVRGYDHLMDCMGMIFAMGPKWHPPRAAEKKRSPMMERFLKKKRREDQRRGAASRNLGPVSSL